MLYKMKNNLTLEYLSNKVPTIVGQNSQYALRNYDKQSTLEQHYIITRFFLHQYENGVVTRNTK